MIEQVRNGEQRKCQCRRDNEHRARLDCSNTQEKYDTECGTAEVACVVFAERRRELDCGEVRVETRRKGLVPETDDELGEKQYEQGDTNEQRHRSILLSGSVVSWRTGCAAI